MTSATLLILIAMAFAGHFGLHLALYNRLNSFGWPRRVIKTIEKTLFVEMCCLPLIVIAFWPELARAIWGLDVTPSMVPAGLAAYGLVCLAAWPGFGIPWLLWRPIFGLEAAGAVRQVEVVDVERETGRPLALTWQCRWESKLPGNQIFDLAVEQVRLPVPGLPAELDGYRIAHLSDIHLTGDIRPEYAQYAVRRAAAWDPDLMALTGDIIDEQACIDWLVEIFSPARAADGCFFVLGNHDTRVVDSWQTREAMDRAGWTDLGSRALDHSLRHVPAQLIGNEHPWFRRPEIETESADFRLLLSHSPDELGWARRHGIPLMLAGHTHGGQGRLPLAGPLLSPSWHGSRYASGDFYVAPTTMHVSRGMGGVHLLRIRCRPELSLITLRTAASPR